MEQKQTVESTFKDLILSILQLSLNLDLWALHNSSAYKTNAMHKSASNIRELIYGIIKTIQGKSESKVQLAGSTLKLLKYSETTIPIISRYLESTIPDVEREFGPDISKLLCELLTELGELRYHLQKK